MEESGVIDFDPRPKRRKAKDNPYEILSRGGGTSSPHYYLAFLDSSGIRQFIEISETLFNVFDRFELDDISYMNKIDRHYEHAEQTESTLNKRAITPQVSLEETVVERIEVERLYAAIAKLSDTQRRRLLQYYFGDLTYTKIAKMEGCSLETVRKSVKTAERNLKKLLDK